MAAAILLRVSKGDPLAVEECISTYERLIWALARRFCPDEATAEDAVQEIFIDLWKNAARFNPERAAEVTFVAMIARRRLIDRLRISRRQPALEALSESLRTTPSNALDLEQTAEAQQILSLLDELEEDRKKALVLAVCDGLTHSEIAEQLTMSLGTVKTHVRRGLEQIRRKLSPLPPTKQLGAAQ